MAGIVVGDHLGKPSPHMSNPQYGSQKVGQLIGSLTHFFCPLSLRRPFGEQAGKKGLDHGDTRSGWYDDMLSVLINPDKLLRHLPALVNESGIESRLSATGLARIEVDLHSAFLENLDGAEADLWKELINETGDKEGDFHNY
jgi:hypothetical protein